MIILESLKTEKKVISFDNVRISFTVIDIKNSSPVFLEEKSPELIEKTLRFIVDEKLDIEKLIEITTIENTLKKSRRKGKGTRALSKFKEKYINDKTLLVLEAGILLSEHKEISLTEEVKILTNLTKFYKKNDFEELYEIRTKRSTRIPFVYKNKVGNDFISKIQKSNLYGFKKSVSSF